MDGILTLHLFVPEFALQGLDMFGKRVGFVKFKADIIDEETKTKVIDWNAATKY
jgi:ADP-sugar diphosphatase